ncbi:MAG: S-layer homology domain-containing protein [Slackia sp.]|nr:S-layer homology domain-containing protein [Slackia sp.]
MKARDAKTERRGAMRQAGFTMALVAALMMGVPAIAHADYLGFTDIDESHWAVADGVVDWASENKVVNGVDGRWMPDAVISRAQAATVLWNLTGNPSPSDKPFFTDADVLDWCADAAAWCQQEGIFTGDGVTGAFDPWAPLTREQCAKVLMVREGGSEGEASSLDRFSDKGTVSGWATGVVAWAVENGVINGVQTDSGRLVQGQRACTRAEFVAMLKNLEDGDSETPGGGTDKPTDPDEPGQGGTGGGTTDPETPAYDPYDIGNGDFVLDADNYSNSGLDGQDCVTFWAGGKYYSKINIGYITNSKTGEELSCKGALTISDDEADFSVVKTYDFDAGTIRVVATGINKYHGTLSITCTFKKYAIVHKGTFLCKVCGKSCNQYTPEGDSSRPRLMAGLCTHESHGASGSINCPVTLDKVYYDSINGRKRANKFVTIDEAVEAGLYCRNSACPKHLQRLTASEVKTNPHPQVDSDHTVGAELYEDHYLTK